jgi:signal transduction histidine kinase/ActR/RegA family two-component response regulator
MLSVLTCIFVEHDLRLVLVAALICATACSAAFGFQLKSVRTGASTMRWGWMALTGLVAGSGVWATHFIAMLAYQPQLLIGYDPGVTIASLATAIVGMGLGFALPVLQPGRAVALTGGALTGLSVGAMHFMGIAAMRMQADVDWNAPYVVASLLIGTLGGAAAFEARSRFRGRAGWVVPSVALVLAIVGLHFTAMTAVRLVPNPALEMPAEVVGRGLLALATVSLAALILIAAASLIWMERMGRHNTLSGVRDALDVVPGGLAFYDAEGRVTSWNKAFAALMRGCGVTLAPGMSRVDLADATLAAGWRPNDEDGHAEVRRRAVEGPQQKPLELKLPDGRWMRHEAFATADGASVTVLTDITEAREAARAMAEARDAAEGANRAKSQFLANMSHEIRTPLNGVLGVADVLETTKLTAKQRELLGVIRSSGALLNALLTDLLDLARVEAGAAELRPEPVSLSEIVTSVRSLFAARAEQKGLKLTVDIDPAVGLVICDGMRLRQILGNLVSNAVKFTDAGQVTIRMRREGERVSFAVRDTGAGFDEALKAVLFGRFQQADDSSTRKHGGAGLGLAICKEYVGLMGGELDCISAPGVGSTFAFTLDLPPLPEAEVAAPAETAGAEPGRFRVLVVDDNQVNRQVLSLILDAAGIEHAEAEDGRVGLEAVMTGGFDAVLMDIQMPVMDGFESTRRIRAWEASAGRPRMPIYIVSANCLQEHVDAGLQAGADGHLSKPVSVPQLIGALEPHAAAAAALAA